jgi:FAD dependent oxidoreductase
LMYADSPRRLVPVNNSDCPADISTDARLMIARPLSRSAAIVSDNSVAADPRALASGFLRRTLQLGARLLAPHEIVDIQSGRRAASAVTRDGFTLECRQIVLCTGYELPKIVPAHGHSIASTWVIATRPLPKALWPDEWTASFGQSKTGLSSIGPIPCHHDALSNTNLVRPCLSQIGVWSSRTRSKASGRTAAGLDQMRTRFLFRPRLLHTTFSVRQNPWQHRSFSAIENKGM